MPDVADIRARFGRADLAPLWAALRARLEAGAGAPVHRVTLADLSERQRGAVAELLGLERIPGARMSVPVARLEAVLADTGLDARAVVEGLGGPLRDRAAERDADRAEREALWRWLAAHPQVAAEPALLGWVDAMRASGLLGGSVPRTRALLASALEVLGSLPADGRPLPSFADAVCGDPHALDDGRRLAAVVLRAVAAWRDVPMPEDAEGRRSLWREVGVACDALSTTVLVAGLRPTSGGVLASALASWADAGEATWVTLAQLDRAPALRTDVPMVWVVENPSVVAEAVRRFGASAPPLVCTSGWPSSACLRLLRDLTSSAELRYTGDLDGDGVRIAAHVHERTGARVWGMGTGDYLRWAAPDLPPAGRITDAPWDAGLADEMRRHGVAVYQERRRDELLDAMADPRQ